MTFTFYTTATDWSRSTAANGAASESGFAAAIAATDNLTAGSYSFSASIAADANYSSAAATCEPFTVGKAAPTLSTKVHNTAHADVTNTALRSEEHTSE